MLVLLPFKMHILLSFNKSKHMKILSLFQSIHLDFYNGLHLYKKTHHTNNSVKSRITHDSKKNPCEHQQVETFIQIITLLCNYRILKKTHYFK